MDDITKQTSLSIIDSLVYRAPFRGFDPRSYSTYWTRDKYPRQYLDSIGIETICEMILNQKSPKEVAVALCVSQYTLRAWLRSDSDKMAAWDEALQYEADNQMFEGRDILDKAPLQSEAISKAAKQAEHRRYMAKGLGQARWGSKLDVKQSVQATLSYQFNIALNEQDKAKLVNGTATTVEVSPIEQLDLNELIGVSQQGLDLSLPKEELTYEEAAGQEE